MEDAVKVGVMFFFFFYLINNEGLLSNYYFLDIINVSFILRFVRNWGRLVIRIVYARLA